MLPRCMVHIVKTRPGKAMIRLGSEKNIIVLRSQKGQLFMANMVTLCNRGGRGKYETLSKLVLFYKWNSGIHCGYI